MRQLAYGDTVYHATYGMCTIVATSPSGYWIQRDSRSSWHHCLPGDIVDYSNVYGAVSALWYTRHESTASTPIDYDDLAETARDLAVLSMPYTSAIGDNWLDRANHMDYLAQWLIDRDYHRDWH